MHHIPRSSQYLGGEVAALARILQQAGAEATPFQSSGLRIRPVSPIALHGLGSPVPAVPQVLTLQHPASPEQGEVEQVNFPSRAPGQGKEQQPEHLPARTVKENATSRSKCLGSVVTGCTSGKTQLKEKSETFQPS